MICCRQALLWLMTIFYVIVFISGLLGNIFVILVITRSRGLHCAMNFYLLSLALADILIIVLGTSSCCVWPGDFQRIIVANHLIELA